VSRAPAAWALALLLAAASASAESPQVLYMLQCQGCHLADGTGKPGAVPALAGHVARFLGVPGGRAFLVRVPGASLSPLSDAELAEVLNWIVRRFGPEEALSGFEPFSEAEVARVRRPPLTDVAAARKELLRALREGPSRTRR
jgi:mono/diheme cytochrome c family protein